MPKCPYCSCENAELDAVQTAIRANPGWGLPTTYVCKNCTCRQKPNH